MTFVVCVNLTYNVKPLCHALLLRYTSFLRKHVSLTAKGIFSVTKFQRAVLQRLCSEMPRHCSCTLRWLFSVLSVDPAPTALLIIVS